MEPIEQINEDFDVKKPKKKGLIIGGIVAAVVIVALVLVYFLVLANPKFIFSKTIDKLLAVDSESYESIKMNTEMKATVDLEDTTYQTQLAEIEKYAVKLGTQIDTEAKKEIVELGLEYDNESVIDAQVYYNDGEMYAYLEELFDKYIELDMDEETKTQMNEIFDAASSDELKNAEKATKILRDELKTQINEKGEFEKTKTTIDVGDDEEKVTKTTLTLSQEELYSVISSMCLNLADNEEFLDCLGEVELAELLEELAEQIKDEETDSKNNMKISIYTKGLLSELVAVDVEIYSAEEKQTIIMTVIKEAKDVYAYNVCVKMSGAKVDVITGKVEIQKDKDSKEEKSGKAIITAEVIQTGSAKLEIDYSVEYNNGVDKIDVENSVNMNDLTETDMQGIMQKLMERPVIGQLLQNALTTQNQNSIVNGTEIEDSIIDGTDTTTQNTLTTTQNEVKDKYYGYSVTYSVPTGFVYDSDYSYDDMKFYELEDVDYSYIDATVSLDWYTEAEYIEDEINWDYDYYTEETDYYTNVNLSEVKTVVVGDKTFKYVMLSYDTNYDTKCQDVYVWYVLDSEYLFTVKLEGTDKEVTEDIIKGFLNNVTVTQLN